MTFKVPLFDLHEPLTARHHFRIWTELWDAFLKKCNGGGYPIVPDEQVRRLMAEWLAEGCQKELFETDENFDLGLDLGRTMRGNKFPRVQPSLLGAYEEACRSLNEKPSHRTRLLIARWVAKKRR